MKKAMGIVLAGILAAVSLTGCGAKENTVHSADDLKGKTIGTQIGTTGYILASDIEGAKTEAYNKGADAVQALKTGKVDAVIIDSEPAEEFVKKNDDLQILDDAYTDEEYAIAYAKDNDKLGDKINKALDELKEDGTLDEIRDHWIGDKADKVSYTSPEDVKTDNGTLVMATNAEFPPYESMDGDKIVGIDADMMQAVCDKLGMKLKIDNMEFDSVITAVETGKADVGVAGISVTEDRKKNVSFTQGYAKSRQVIITRKD